MFQCQGSVQCKCWRGSDSLPSGNVSWRSDGSLMDHSMALYRLKQRWTLRWKNTQQAKDHGMYKEYPKRLYRIISSRKGTHFRNLLHKTRQCRHSFGASRSGAFFWRTSLAFQITSSKSSWHLHPRVSWCAWCLESTVSMVMERDYNSKSVLEWV